METTFYPGQSVTTRRGKRGTVVSESAGLVDVRFGASVFTMRVTQLVSSDALAKAVRRASRPTFYGA